MSLFNNLHYKGRLVNKFIHNITFSNFCLVEDMKLLEKLK
jgi:hypothetical protein